MTTPSKKRSRGRPSGVTPEQLRIAILGIQGHVPTLDDLCDKLAVQKTTLYKYVRGQDALVQLAADIVMAESRVPTVTPGMHWAEWARLYAWSQLKGFQRYPVLLEQLTPHPRQMTHLEEAISALAKDFTPLTDMRATADYRLRVAGNLLLRFYHEINGAGEHTSHVLHYANAK